MVMIIKTREELGEAYWNFVGSAKDWQTPRQRGNWMRAREVYPQKDGTLGFNTEEDLVMFLLKWS
jgi:hypothetical protein